jgi:hypothetical protein
MITRIRCLLGLHDFEEKDIWNQEGEFSHFDLRCRHCPAHFEQWTDRLTGKDRRVKVAR